MREFDLDTLKKECKLAAVVIDDPYYKRKKSYLAFPLKQVLALGFAEGAADIAKENLVFEALDGYAKPSAGARAVEDGGYLAFADADHTHGSEPGWEPIDRRGLDPGPYYVVWAKPEQSDANGYPWPFELASIEIVHFEKKYPYTLPTASAAGSAPWKGFEIFRTQCLSCHSINGQGGKVGPDLNVPQSIVEYRPIPQVKAYIRDPQTFRYSTMPAHRELSDAQLDQLIAYFTAMKAQKHDPGAQQ
ncbi:MAG TPA: cytochrome c [Candidatus Binatia bacterium]|nr:cytochrome c [Candidatus Binatia bacterium]